MGTADKVFRFSEEMKTRGYPISDQRAADISIDHPRVVENYRSAHEIALRVGPRQGVEGRSLPKPNKQSLLRGENTNRGASGRAFPHAPRALGS